MANREKAGFIGIFDVWVLYFSDIMIDNDRIYTFFLLIIMIHSSTHYGSINVLRDDSLYVADLKGGHIIKSMVSARPSRI